MGAWDFALEEIQSTANPDLFGPFAVEKTYPQGQHSSFCH